MKQAVTQYNAALEKSLKSLGTFNRDLRDFHQVVVAMKEDQTTLSNGMKENCFNLEQLTKSNAEMGESIEQLSLILERELLPR